MAVRRRISPAISERGDVVVGAIAHDAHSLRLRQRRLEERMRRRSASGMDSNRCALGRRALNGHDRRKVQKEVKNPSLPWLAWGDAARHYGTLILFLTSREARIHTMYTCGPPTP